MRGRVLWNKDEAGGTGADPDATTDPPTTDPPDRQAKGLQIALAAERAKRQAATDELAALKATARATADAERAANGEASALLAERDAELAAALEQIAVHDKATAARTARLAKDNKTRTAKLPEAWRALVPDGLDAEATARHLTRIEGMTGEDGAPVGTRSRAPTRKEPKIPQACIEEAARYGRDPLIHFDTVWKPRQERQKRRQ